MLEPNVFFILIIKHQPRKIKVSEFEYLFLIRYTSLLAQKCGVGNENHQTMTDFVENGKNWFSWILVMKKICFILVVVIFS